MASALRSGRRGPRFKSAYPDGVGLQPACWSAGPQPARDAGCAGAQGNGAFKPLNTRRGFDPRGITKCRMRRETTCPCSLRLAPKYLGGWSDTGM